MSQKAYHMRYEKIILGRIRCEKAPQVVRAWSQKCWKNGLKVKLAVFAKVLDPFQWKLSYYSLAGFQNRRLSIDDTWSEIRRVVAWRLDKICSCSYTQEKSECRALNSARIKIFAYTRQKTLQSNAQSLALDSAAATWKSHRHKPGGRSGGCRRRWWYGWGKGGESWKSSGKHSARTFVKKKLCYYY